MSDESYFRVSLFKSLVLNLGRRFAAVLIFGATALYFLVEIMPLFQSRESLTAAARHDPDFISLVALEEVALGRTREGRTFVNTNAVALTSLVDVEFTATTFGADKGPVLKKSEVVARPRWDRLILYSGSLAMLILVILNAPSVFIRTGAFELEARTRAGDLKAPEVSAPATTESVLREEVAGAERKAEEMFSRSTLLLIGGIIMAFIGIGIFYVSLPEYKTGESPTGYLPKAIRPTGVLFFIEGIAWFLLRQYRALIEDFKFFHRLYVKRANYMAAYKIVSSDRVKPEELFLAACLVGEDLSGILRGGETTEAIEREKLPDHNPVFSLLETIVGRSKEQAKGG